MSCPLGYKPKAVDDTPLPDDITGEHVKLLAAFDSLLPNCTNLSTKLDECREKIAASSTGGSCLEESRSWMRCFNRRSQLSRAIVETCGGEDNSSHGELQQKYIGCMRQGSKNISAAKQKICLEPLRSFLSCATSVTTNDV